MTDPKSTLIPIGEIGYEPAYYPRSSGREDWLTVARYADALKSDPKLEFPPVTVVRCHGRKFAHLIIDGLHRVRAYYQAKREVVPAVIERIPESRWFARSVELNARHGRCFDVGDKAFIAKTLEAAGHSLEDVARLLVMTPDSLKKIVGDRAVRLTGKQAELIKPGRGNREIGGDRYGFLKSPFVEANATPSSAVAALAVQSPVAAGNALQILDSACAVLEAGCLDPADEAVAASVRRLNGLASAWLLGND